MKKFLTIAIATFTAAMIYVGVNSHVYAQCQPIYGGGVTCPSINITLNKVVQNPSTGGFVDNLGINDPKYTADQVITFQITVTNTGNTTIGKATFRDILPQFINFVTGPGSFDNNTKTLTFDIINIQAGESRTITVQGRVVPENQLPSNIGIACITNQSTLTMEDGRSAGDNAQLCIERKILGAQPGPQIFPPSEVKVIPVTGPEALYLLAFIPSALAGLIIRKSAYGRSASGGKAR